MDRRRESKICSPSFLRYAIEHLERAGLVKMRTVTTRKQRCILAAQTWYRVDYSAWCDDQSPGRFLEAIEEDSRA